MHARLGMGDLIDDCGVDAQSARPDMSGDKWSGALMFGATGPTRAWVPGKLDATSVVGHVAGCTEWLQGLSACCLLQH